MKKFKDDEEMKECGLYWQRQLRLQDWNVDYTIRPHHHFDKADGHSVSVLEVKRSTICLMEHSHHSNKEDFDHEEVLVHELLHLHFEQFMKIGDHAERVPQEQAIDLIACALVRLNRGEQR